MRYITADIYQDRIYPMGGDKTLEECQRLAKLHKQVICEIRVLDDSNLTYIPSERKEYGTKSMDEAWFRRDISSL